MGLYLFFLLLFSKLYRKMPRALSDVWRHFTVANVEGKAVYMCKNCAKSYVKNATKMQNHLAKCIKFPQRSQQATSDKSPSTSIRENDEADSLSIAPAHGPPGSKSFFWLYGGTKSEKCWWLSCSSCVCNWFTSDAQRPCVLEEISECSLPSIHPSNQTCFIYSFAGCRVQIKVNQIIEKAVCIAIISDGLSNVCGQGIINYIIYTPQPVFYKSTDTRDNSHTSHHWPWTTDGICTGDRQCCEHESCLV